MKRSTMNAALLAAGLSMSMGAMAATTLIKDVRVFDGERMHAKRSVLIDGAKIVNADFHGALPAGTNVVSGAGRTLVPGLIDAHVHTYQHRELPLLFGVTTEIDMFTSVALMQETSRKMAEGSNSGQADMFSAGTLATVPGGHGTEYGMVIPTLTTPGEAQAFVDARIAEGSRFIKIVMEGGTAKVTSPTLDNDTVTALIKAAHLRGKLAVVHVSTLESARTAIEAGADGLVHLFVGRSIEPDAMAGLVQLAKSHHAFVIPTFSVLESIAGVTADDVLADKSMMSLLDRAETATMRKPYGVKPDPDRLTVPKAMTLALSRAGVPILAGTDAGNNGTDHGISLHHELASLVASGLTPLQALKAATSAPANAFKLGNRGSIRAGYKADLLLVEGDPSADITSTRRIVAVWKDGVDATGLRATQQARVASEAAPASEPSVALPTDGRISKFSAEKLASPFGFGWMPSVDNFMGGKSSVKLAAQAPDANGQQALDIQASVETGFAYPWAGVAFLPGAKPMDPANLSGAKTIRFKVRGDGNTYSLSMMAKGTQIPVNVAFTAPAAWTEVAIPFSQFKGIDASMVTMIAFNAGPKVGNYAFQLVDVRLTND
ncbi:MAG: CIA30 family protein [Massilia sp.]